MKPSEEEALRLHRKHGSNDAIIRHCKTVAMVTAVLAEEFRRQGKEIDSKAAVAGALLHDIGRSKVQTVRHGLVGSEMLEEEGVDESVVQIVRRHVGAGISPEEAKKLGFPNHDYVPRTREQVAVCFADKMVDADGVRPFEEEVRRFERKGHDVQRLLELKRDLEADLGVDPEALVLDKIKGTR
ncbi:MAG: HDIG domain-containing metalloprotein [Nitrososphaerales archaeon]